MLQVASYMWHTCVMTSEEALREHCEAVVRAQLNLDDSRARRDQAIAAAAGHLRMRDLVRITNLTREHLRRIIRDTPKENS